MTALALAPAHPTWCQDDHAARGSRCHHIEPVIPLSRHTTRLAINRVDRRHLVVGLFRQDDGLAIDLDLSELLDDGELPVSVLTIDEAEHVAKALMRLVALARS